MRILTYKRTHVGDPDQFGRFGINDCMGKVRNFSYDAVIGVGGTGYEPRRHGIDRKINWVGIGPKRASRINGYRAGVIEFEHFVLFERFGPLLHSLAPHLARKIFNGRRYILDAYSEIEKTEAIAIVEWAKNVAGHSVSQLELAAVKCKIQTKCRTPPEPQLHRICTKNRTRR